MNSDSSFDRESFQALLANAYSVQQSGMKPESLAAIIEIQRVVTSDGVAADYAMNLVAERARAVANASGIGVALLEGNQLVHRAGSGTALQNVGSQLTAVLSIAGCDHPRREILRVEDARTDSRIEAEICRQFDVQALLLVPIYRDRAMIGVLEVLYQEAHSFSEPEVRTYQLMATLAGDASALRVAGAERAPVSSTISRAVLRMNAQLQSLGHGLNRVAEVAIESRSHAWYESLLDFWRQLALQGTAVKGKLSRIRLPEWHWPETSKPKFRWSHIALPALRWPRLRVNMQWRNNANLIWNVAAVSLVLALAMIAAVARHYSTVLPVAESSPAAVTPVPAQTPLLPEQQPAAIPAVKTRAAAVHDADAPSASFKRLRVGKDEVDYVADDVTIRQFRPVPAPKKARRASKQVRIGEDVTVRYFNSAPAAGRPTATDTTEQAVKD